MGVEKRRLYSFTDLEVWKQAHLFRISILKLILKFPPDYRFGLASQLQRASISVGSNIAEGFGRHNQKEKAQFYRIARGSLTETQDQLIVARDIGILSSVEFDRLAKQSVEIHKQINGLIRSMQNSPAPTPNSKPLSPEMEL